MAVYQVVFWESDSGDKPVAKWIKSLSKKDQLYLGGLLKDLAIDGPFSRPKVFRHLDHDLWEIRDLRSPGPGYRIYFGYSGGSIICLVVNAGNKSTQQRDIELAKQRLSNEV
jgi:putative addiction module killer protein